MKVCQFTSLLLNWDQRFKTNLSGEKYFPSSFKKIVLWKHNWHNFSLWNRRRHLLSQSRFHTRLDLSLIISFISRDCNLFKSPGKRWKIRFWSVVSIEKTLNVGINFLSKRKHFLVKFSRSSSFEMLILLVAWMKNWKKRQGTSWIWNMRSETRPEENFLDLWCEKK